MNTEQASAMAPLREIQGKEDSRLGLGLCLAVQGPGNLCTAEELYEGFEKLSRAMLHLEQRAVEFVPRWRHLPGADSDALMIIYDLRFGLTRDYMRMLKAKRAHKAVA